MTTKTYYGMLDCSASHVTAENTTGTHYKSLMNFMSYLTASNVATLIAWNSGSTTSSGSFNERTYFDGAKPYGVGAHSVWKMHTSSTRNWEWYMYLQVVSGAAGAIRQAFNTPISGYANAGDNILGSSANRGILIQTALCISGTTSFNPWSGSLGTGSFDGSDNAGNPRWHSGSINNNLYVLPRNNDVGSITPLCFSQKSNAVILGNVLASSDTPIVFSYIYDGDALVYVSDNNLNTTYGAGYVGAFELRNSLTGSGFGNGPHGFIMLTNSVKDATNTLVLNASIGDTAGIAPSNGGIALPPNIVSGSKIAILNSLSSFLSTTFGSSSLTSKYDEHPIYVGYNENPYNGYVGCLNTGLVKFMFKTSNHDVSVTPAKAVFGGANNNTTMKISIPWTGSNAPGVAGASSRSGSFYTWTANYE